MGSGTPATYDDGVFLFGAGFRIVANPETVVAIVGIKIPLPCNCFIQTGLVLEPAVRGELPGLSNVVEMEPQGSMFISCVDDKNIVFVTPLPFAAYKLVFRRFLHSNDRHKIMVRLELRFTLES